MENRMISTWEQGPKIVAVGGGHGLSTMLRGLKSRTQNLTAIVTVSDDGTMQIVFEENTYIDEKIQITGDNYTKYVI